MRKRANLCAYVIIGIFLFCRIAIAGEKVSFYITDPAGTPLAMTDSDGNVVWRADYKPFGEVQSTTGAIENNKQFIGKEKDKETGLHNIGVRYMKDEIGRFISPDPVGPVDPRTSRTNYEMLTNPQKLNLYAYALNNPYRYVDPDGRYERDVHYNLTYFLANKAGFNRNQARQIASADQGVDDSGITGAFVGREARRNYHFATQERLNRMLSAAYSTGDLNLFGQFLHAFQDSYSHAGYGPSIGHILAGTAPDKTYNDANNANAMAEATYTYMNNFLKHIGLTATDDWVTVRDQVDQFNRARTVAEKEKILSR